MTAAARPSPPQALVVPSFIAMLAVAASILPLWNLFTGRPWTGPVAAVLGVIAGAGIVCRAVGVPRPAVPVVQSLALGALLTALFGGDTGAVGLIPLPGTFTAWAALLRDALEAIASSAPPAPSTAGVVFAVSAGAGVVAVCTDAIGVTWARPALAGLPLLVPFLVSVANAAGGLQMRYVLTLGACWLALLAVVDDARVAGWSRGVGRRSGSRAARRSRLSTAAVTAVVALAGSVALSSLVPVSADSALSRRLGISGGAGRVGFSPSPDMLSDLRDSSPVTVLRYTTTDPAAPPLRVSVATSYQDGSWQPQQVREPVSSTPVIAAPPGLGRGVRRAERTLSSLENRLAAPNLAAPERVTSGVVTGSEWSMDPGTGVLAVGTMPSRYELKYLTVQPTPAQLRSAPARTDAISEDDPVLDTSGVSEQTARTAAQVTSAAATPYDKAVALQNWFRSAGGFTYSLELDRGPDQAGSAQAGRTSVDRFLQTKRGYCVQFSTAMTLMARSVGIPARLATGFLPGRSEDGARVVRSTDAHAWPELYFEGVGWLRFEPTPGVHAGPAPQHAPDQADSGETSPTTPEGTPTAAPSEPEASAQPSPSPEPQQQQPSTPQDTSVSREFPWQLVLYILLATAVAAAIAWLVTLPARVAARDRRRRLAAAATPSQEIIAVWDGLLEQLADLGVRAGPALVLPEQATTLARDLELAAPAEERLRRLAQAVETARYAPGEPLRPADEAAGDARAVLEAARASRTFGQRLSARAMPASGRARVSAQMRAAVARFGIADRVRSLIARVRRSR